MVGKGAHGSKAGALLATTLGAGGNEETGVLAPEASLLPLLASLVPEGLELGGEVAVTCGDTEEDTVKLLEDGWVVDDGHIGLGGGVHLLEDLLGKCLGDPATWLVHGYTRRGFKYLLEDLGVAASLFDALGLSIGLVLLLAWSHVA